MYKRQGKVYANTHLACIYNVDDPQTEQLVRDADVVEGCRAVGFTLGIPALSMLGVVDDILADRAFVEQRAHSAAELGSLADLRGAGTSLAPHYVANALAAAALARAYGVGPLAVRDGLRSFRPDAHRIAEVATVEGVLFVDDSKATNPHAAGAALAAYESVVWVAGGQLKGADVDSLVARYAAVSYTHLDVYKRQRHTSRSSGTSRSTRSPSPRWAWPCSSSGPISSSPVCRTG